MDAENAETDGRVSILWILWILWVVYIFWAFDLWRSYFSELI